MLTRIHYQNSPIHLLKNYREKKEMAGFKFSMQLHSDTLEEKFETKVLQSLYVRVLILSHFTKSEKDLKT